MKSRRRLPRAVAFLALGVVMVLASLGLGYAYWADQLTVNGLVNTGTMKSQWLTFPIASVENEGSGPNVAQIACSRDSANTQLVHFTITNGYPGYLAYCSFPWKNIGTIPMRITSLDINGTTITSGSATDYDLAGDSQPDVRITFWDGVGSSYAPGAGDSKAMQVEVLSGAPQGVPLTFTGHVNFVQWNAP